MDILRIVEFDIHGVKPINKIDMEEISIENKCPWVIPNGSPFFGDYPGADGLPLTVVYDESGAELTRDRDYFLEEEFIPLVAVTGRPIVCFVRLSDEILASNKKIKISYRSVGAYFVPRNSLEEWIKKIQTGVVPIPWSKVFEVPPTLPSEWHSHSVKTEIGDWFELTWFFTYLERIISTKDPLVEVGVDQAIRAAFDMLYQTRDAQQLALNNHDRNYQKPHGTTKGDVLLGNHDNYGTGTIADHRIGQRSDLFATPQGIQTLIDDNVPDTSSFMRTGLMPLSRFGKLGYIPPTITGSFEGLGSKSECMGICLEEDGRCITIQNHYDGRTEGLYFSAVSDVRKPFTQNNPYSFEFTAYKYEPPVLTNIGVTPNAIVMGSGNDVIMVGKANTVNAATTDRWFIALTNNSFDPSGHRYIETSMANVFAECGNPTSEGTWLGGFFYHARMSIDLLGDWVMLTVDAVPKDYGSQGRMVRFRIPKASLIAGTPTAWQLFKVTYQDYDGIQYTNANSWEWAKKVNTNGNLTRWGRYDFTPKPPPFGAGSLNRRILTLYGKKPGTTNIYYVNWLAYTFLDWIIPDDSYNPSASITNMVYELNIDTGVMTLIYKPPKLTINFLTNNIDEVMADREIWMVWYGPMVRYLYPATVVTPNGETISSMTGNRQEGTVLNSVIEYYQFDEINVGRVTSKAQLLAGSLGKDRIKLFLDNVRLRNIQTPIPIGLGSRWVAYEQQGENFMTSPTTIKDYNYGAQNPQVVCRDVAGLYAVRDTVPNKQLSPVYSRPLTNKVYATNMSWLDGVISMSGTVAELNGRGAECGNMSMSACGQTSIGLPGYGPYNEFPSNAQRSANEQGAVITFPKTYTRTLDQATQTMMYVPTAYYGISAAVKNKIRALIPAAQQGDYWSYSVFMLNEEAGAMFGGLNKMLIYVKYPTQASGAGSTRDAQMFFVNPVVEVPNAAHPGCHLITDFTVLGKAGPYIQHRAMISNQAGAVVDISNRPFFSLFRNGNTAQCVLNAGFAVVGGTVYTDLTVFNVNLTTGAFNQVAGSQVSWEQGDGVTVIPRVGRSKFAVSAPDTYNADISDWANINLTTLTSGGAARLMPSVRGDGGTDYYAVITGYPETGWAIFFLEEVETMINGTLYTMPIGSIDLRDIDVAPQNKTFWIYATVEDQKGRYVISSVKLRSTSSLIHAATVTTGPNQILLIDRHQPFMIGDLELSHTRKGGSIPVSSGFPQEDGNFTFLRAGELLP